MNNFVKIFIYLSLFFLVYFLYKNNLLIIPKVYNFSFVVFSLFFVILGFVLQGYQYKYLLKIWNIDISGRISIESFGMTVFGKYIPGKIWMIVGRATYIAKHTKVSIQTLSLVSVNSQLINLWCGLILGLIGLIFVIGIHYWTLLTGLLWLLLTLVIFTAYFNVFISFVINKFFKHKINIPYIHFFRILKIIPLYIFSWIFWAIGFYFLIEGFTIQNVNFWVSMSFPLAGTFGIMAIFAPGGLGVREAILTGYFTLIDLPKDFSVTISALSRLWFLIGEISIFVFALILNKKGVN